MCGRFALGIPKKLVEELTAPGLPEDFRERFNIAPSSRIPVLKFHGWEMETWGVQPGRHSAGTAGKKTPVPRMVINARSESVFDKPMFRTGIMHGRNLVPAAAFYEWKRTGSGRVPHAFVMRDAPLFTMAGITVGPSRHPSTVILTCAADADVAPVHHRMPVIIPPESRQAWLDPKAGPEILESLLVPLPHGLLHGYPVSPAVNTPANDFPSCLDPATPGPSLLDF